MKRAVTVLAGLILAVSSLLAGQIAPDLAARLQTSVKPGEKLPVEFYMRDQADALVLDPSLGELPKPLRRARVAEVLRNFAQASQQELLEYLKAQEAEGKVEGITSLWIINAVGCYATPEVIAEIAARSDVAWAVFGEVDCDLPKPQETFEPPAEGIEPNVALVRAPGAWKQGYTGQGIVVGVIDTGVWYTHLDLRNHLWSSPNYPKCGFNYASRQLYPNATNPSPNDTTEPIDYVIGHGTHCAGLVAGDGSYGNGTNDTVGIAPSALIMALPVLVYFNGDSERVMEQSMLQAYQFAISPPRDPTNGADLITMSLGIFYSRYPRRQYYRQAEANMMHAGVTHLVAAGNEASPRTIRCPGDCPPPWPNPANHPTDHDSTAVITVGATDINDQLTSFSSEGPMDWTDIAPYYDYDYPPGGIDPDVTAPGSIDNGGSNGLFSTFWQSDQAYTRMAGTSMATPTVAGCVALMLSKNPELSPRQVDSILECHAVVDLGPAGKDNQYGAGRINCSLAVAFTPLPTGIRPLRYVIDDAPPGGNGDGVINPGETINLPLWVLNRNGRPTLGVWGYLRKDTADPNVTLIDTVRYFGNIATDDSAYTGPSGFKFSVASGLPNGYGLPLSLDCRDTLDSLWHNPLGLAVGTAELVGSTNIVHDPPPGGNGNGKLDRGETVDLEIGIRNIGMGNAANVEVHLVSMDSRFQILDSIGTYGDIRHDTTVFNSADQFRVHADFSIPIEFQIPCSLRIFATGYTATRYYEIPCGVLTATDPIPDGPRTPALYYAYDDVDTFYTEHPTYNWIEIRGRGTRLSLSDDQTVTISLPPAFGSFRYYGRTYTQLSICSNGFVMPGSFTYTSYTNQQLPYTSINAPMLCGSWDDLYPPVGGGVWYFHDTANHAFVIEYDSVAYYSPQTEWDKFEIILYDSTTRSRTGDNEFAFQYMTARNYISNTVGEQDPTYSIAIQALYNNTYHRACAQIVARRAIKFTTDTIAVGISEKPQTIASARLALSVGQNPFRGTGKISFSLPAAMPVRVVMYDISGRTVRTLFTSNGAPVAAGDYSLSWNGTDDNGGTVARGVYLCRLETPNQVLVQKTIKVE